MRVVYEFSNFRVDPVMRQLSSRGAAMPLTAKAFETLLVLLSSRGELVSKGDLLDAVWQDTAVEENNLTQQIATLRRAFGERAGEHRFIVTVPGRGYSFVAAVNEIEITGSEIVTIESTDSSITLDIFGELLPALRGRFEKGAGLGAALAMVYVAFVCFLGIWPMVIGGSPTHAARPTYAVLNFTSSVEDAALGAGIRDTLRARLGSVEDVEVRPNRLAFPSEDVLIAGKEMKADVVLTGSVQRVAERVRVVVEMVDVNRERVVWANTFDRDSAEYFELQDAIAKEALRAITTPRL
ncbi:MAG: winged helix-turn-helix domain-containing protein [Pyrinomonadaceae bacterium]